MNIKKILTPIVALVLVISLTSCSNTGNPGETTTGNIDIPSWNTSGYTPAPDLSQITRSDGADLETPSAASWGEATASEGVNTSNYTEYTANSENAPDLRNITIDTKNGVISSTDKEMILGVHNRTGWEIVFSKKYILKKNNNGSLVDVPFVDSPDFGEEGYLLGNGKDSFVVIDLSQLKTSLEAGSYMIGLNMFCNGYPGDFYSYTTFVVK